MRFMTEFEIVYPYTLNKPYAHMERAKYDMGQLLQNSFDWKERAYRKHDETEVNRWVFEIEAFPSDKWAEFKRLLFVYLGATGLYEPAFKHLIAELESFGKPSGDTMPSNPPIQQTDVKYYYDNLEGKVYKQDGNGQIDDITNQQLNK